jgi:hypothetical protein
MGQYAEGSSSGVSEHPCAGGGHPGFIFALPFGISFFGRAGSELALLKIAYRFEPNKIYRSHSGRNMI